MVNSKLLFKYFSFVIAVFALGFFVLPKTSFSRDVSPDAIAVRVIPNPNHYSVTRWYKEQGFRGNPQQFKVDEYRALRDGSTVYVNAANITGECVNGNGTVVTNSIVCSTDDECVAEYEIDTPPYTCNLTNFYTNIYVIAKNRGADALTENIFTQVLNSFKLNANLPEPGICQNLADTDCANDNDCEAGEECDTANGQNPGVCQLKCDYDYDCPSESYCSSDKAEVIRDVKRLADLTDIKIALNNYRGIHGHYPKLESGTYVPHMTLSTWPSWQKTLARELGLPSLPTDPINRLGECVSAYNPNGDDNGSSIQISPDPITCWDEVNKIFADTDPNDSGPNLPSNSHVYLYITDPEGLGYGIE